MINGKSKAMFVKRTGVDSYQTCKFPGDDYKGRYQQYIVLEVHD